MDDPVADGWNSESLSLKASAQLKVIAQLLASAGPSAVPAANEVVTDDFVCDWLRPPHRKRVQVTDESLLVYRLADGGQTTSSTAPQPAGSACLAAVVGGLRQPFSGPIRVETKVIGIAPRKQQFTTTVLFQSFGQGTSGSIQQNARWICDWIDGQGDSQPRLKKVTVEDYEEVLLRGGTTTLVDCTNAVMPGDAAFEQQLRPGIDHWMQRLPTALGITPWGDHGLAIGDVNGDNRDDIYLCQPGGLPNLLYVHQPDGTLQNISRLSGTDWLDDTRSALLLDLDNDGDQDLVIGSREFLLLMENDGAGRFRMRADFREARDAFSLSAADYDNDGDLDIHVCRYYSDGSQLDTQRVRFSAPLPYHDATNGPPNVLLRNDGGWKFREAAVPGMQQGNHRWSYAAAWEDYDNDGDQDIYIANDFGPNNLYRNDKGSFTDVAAAAGALDASTGMSVDWADYNRDGWLDLYVGNMFSAAGQRVMSQLQFKPGEDDQMRDRYRHLARGNTLLQNQRDGAFRDVTLSAAVNMGRWAWSSNFVDLNNDGWDDLVVANGYYSGEKKDDL